MSNDLNSLRARLPYISLPEFCQGGKTALQKGTQIISSLIRIRLCKRRQRHAASSEAFLPGKLARRICDGKSAADGEGGARAGQWSIARHICYASAG
jgi:hypothetical protein